MFKLCLIFFALLSSCFCSNINFRDLLFFKTKKYPLKHYEKVVVLTPERTGSTLIFNIAKTLFESRKKEDFDAFYENTGLILKRHFSKELIQINPDYLYLSTYRNPYSLIESKLKIIDNYPTYGNRLKFFTKHLANEVLKDYMNLKTLLDKDNVVFFRYEEFVKNFGYIFEKLEKTLNISIAKKDKELIQKYLNKKQILQFIKNLQGFDTYDRETQFHGNHIDKNPFPKYIKDIIKNEARPIFLEKKALFEEFGYKID